MSHLHAQGLQVLEGLVPLESYRDTTSSTVIMGNSIGLGAIVGNLT